MPDLKLKIIAACHLHFSKKIDELMIVLNDLKDAANSETKSTVGDKHETVRAMMQLEQEKLGKQLFELEEQQKELKKIEFNKPFYKAALGSLIETNRGLFFIATGIGKLEVEAQNIYVISNRSPLALHLLGLEENGKIEFNKVLYIIKSIC